MSVDNPYHRPNGTVNQDGEGILPMLKRMANADPDWAPTGMTRQQLEKWMDDNV